MIFSRLSALRLSTFWVSTSILAACVVAPPQKNEDSEKAEAQDDKAEAKAPAEVDPKEKYKLTEEELALLERDPKDLTPDQNRKRGQALRKKIMQNPDSDAAKALEEARQAVLSGELQIPGAEPPANDPGMVIEAPDHVRRDSSTDPSLAKDK